MFKKILAASAISLALVGSAHAQFASGNANLSVTTSSANVALPTLTSSAQSLLIVPVSGSSEVFYNFGVDNTVTAATTGKALPNGGICLAPGQSNKFIAGITATGTATLRITQVSTCPAFAASGTGSSGSSTVQGNQSNASSGVSTSSTNVPDVGYNYLWNGSTWDQATGLLTGTAGAPGADVVTTQAPINLGSAGFPTASTPITGNSTGTTGAVVGTLAANATKNTYICGFSVSAIGGTAAVGPITIAGTITASLVYYLASSVAGTELTQTFTPCIPSSAINTAITTTTTADGTASNVAVNSWGFQQ